jgi:hypothetical protein
MNVLIHRSLALAAAAITAAAIAAGSSASIAPAPCTPKAPSRVARNPWRAAKQTLIPPGANAVRLCRYAPLPGLELVKANLVTDPTLVARLVSEFDKLRAAPSGPVACPNDNGAQILARVSYPDGHAVTVLVSLGGCGDVTNGDVVRSGTRALFGELKRLTPTPMLTLQARRIRVPRRGGLSPGTIVRRSFAGTRVFANAGVGFAIADLASGGGATYPLLTRDGGRTWRIDGPALHVPAAQGPLAVDQIGIRGVRMFFAWCGGCGNVVDVTPDAGAHWWRTFMPGDVAYLKAQRSRLTAFVEGPTPDPGGRGLSLRAYGTRDGRRWRYLYDLNVVS